ncbi:unnamed protein product [Owenia fusiformis]|uniref:Uncharacterized protein n=1 Tax=Owenia fusiformis TaxID=6347 RepID=A0A8J1UGN7_OWEFU|nr:unnamed protein product [Owenia fusiformis]
MSKRKQEIALQQELETQEEWEEMLAKEGLIVIDVYQEWCGPCKALVTNLKRYKNETADDLLHFAVAKADTIDALERYRGKCEPCFLFFAGGVLVAVRRGANSPCILKSIAEQLKKEHAVLDGDAEREEIRDPGLADIEPEKGADDEDDTEKEAEEEAIKKEVTVAILKPDIVKEEGKVEEILQKMEEAGIEVLEKTEKQLTEEEAREFYAHQKEEEWFEELITHMTSGPSFVLVLTKGDTGENVIQGWRDMIGPTMVEDAKENAPESLRAQYGSEKYFNALHGSDSKETSARELAFFFPDFNVPVVPGSGPKPKIQRTLALIRPDALTESKDAILEKIRAAGFEVALQKEVQLTKEQAEEFYKEHEGQDYFEELTTRMSSGPLLALGLAREDGIERWRDMLGPKEVDKAKEEAPESLRAQFAVEDVPINPLHGSDSPSTAEKEIDYFFPMQQTLAVVKPDAYDNRDEIMDKIKEAGFHIAARKETELTKEMAEAFYKDQNDKEFFSDLTEHMTSGPTLFMVLSRNDAVDGWRSVIGPTDPEQAKEAAPETLRAKYGKDVKANALHGSSSVNHAHEGIKEIFGDLEFNKDGTLKEETGEGEKENEDTDEPADGEGEEKEEDPAGEEEQEGAGDADDEYADEFDEDGDDVKSSLEEKQEDEDTEKQTDGEDGDKQEDTQDEGEASTEAEKTEEKPADTEETKEDTKEEEEGETAKEEEEKTAEGESSEQTEDKDKEKPDEPKAE